MQKEKNFNTAKEFSRFAYQYDKHNMIQTQVAKELISKLPQNNYNDIIDVGCGTGAVYKNLLKNNINFKSITVIDASDKMLNLHPSGNKIIKQNENFNEENFLIDLNKKKFDLVLSSSALQWSDNLDFTFNKISKLSSSLIASIFTSNTFKTIHEIAGISSPIYSAQDLKKVIHKYYDATFVVHSYKLEFDNVREMFQYIKKSGVSSGEKKLSYIQIKSLMRSYPLNYLEFEVLYVIGKVKL